MKVPKVKEMKTKARQSGISLTEMTVVVAAVALLANLSMPAIRTFFDSLASRDSARAMISASLSASRAIAAREQRYAGIRFQKAWHPQGPLYSPQYMIFIVHDPEATNISSSILANGFRAVEGIKPIKLPEGIGVMDLRLGTDADKNIMSDADILDNWQIVDTTTFSIIFSPSGKMVIHDVRVRNRDGRTETNETIDVSRDDVFNTWRKIIDPNGAGMFVQDDYFGAAWSPYPNLGLGEEPSRRSFVIYEKDKFQQAFLKGLPYSDYLEQLVVPVPQMIYINSYTGRIID